MDASVVLPAYIPNRELLDITRRCIASLKDTADDYQLIVVDNGSTRAAQSFLRVIADLYVRKEEPIGYARASNIGLALADADWIVVLNTDVEFTEKGWLERFKADYAQTGGGVLSAMDYPRPEGIYFDESWFSCWITQRRIVQKVGYFDESLPFRFHDQDYAIRLTRAGYRVMRTTNVQVKHIDGATYGQMGRNEDPEEAAEMRRRWGAIDFAEWIRKGQPAPA